MSEEKERTPFVDLFNDLNYSDEELMEYPNVRPHEPAMPAKGEKGASDDRARH